MTYKSLLVVVALGATLLLPIVNAEAAPITWEFFGGGNDGLLGHSQTYVSGGHSVTAEAFTGGNAFTNALLLGKNTGPDDEGLGVCLSVQDCNGGLETSELYRGDTVRLNLGTLPSTLTGWSAIMSSVEDDEQFAIWTSDSSTIDFSDPSQRICTGGPSAGPCALVPKQYLFFTTFGDGENPGVLVHSVSAQSIANPEPATLLLMGSGLLGLASWRFRMNRKATHRDV